LSSTPWLNIGLAGSTIKRECGHLRHYIKSLSPISMYPDLSAQCSEPLYHHRCQFIQLTLVKGRLNQLALLFPKVALARQQTQSK
jgi:hypothetical protein